MTEDPKMFYEFGDFRLDPHEKVLWRDGQVANVTPKAIETLLVLVENPGRIISKEEIFRRVWPNSFVEEANLTHHIFRLRKHLGETEETKFIETVPKRGYRFTAKVNNRLTSESLASIPRTKRSFAVLASAGLLAIAVVTGLVWLKFGVASTKNQVESAKPEDAGPMTITRVTNSGKSAAPTISRDGKFIAYVSYVSGTALVVRETGTNIETQLVAPADHTLGLAAFSPEGTTIYYVVFDKNDPKGALYKNSILGGEPKRVLGDLNSMFSLSADGRRAAFYRNDTEHGQTKVIIAELDGSGAEQTILTLNDAERAKGGPPAFSPDGKMLALALTEGTVTPGVRTLGMFTCDLNGEIKALTEERWLEVGMINWMPDASGIVFVGRRPRIGNQIYSLSYPNGELRRITKELGSYGNYGMGITSDGTTMVADIWESSAQLWRTAADGTTGRSTQLTSGDSEGTRGLTSFPDGEIVYSSRTGFDYDLWALHDAGGQREGKPLTSDAFFEIDAAASPDGKFVVFASDRAGGQHLFRIDRNGSNLRQLTSGEGFDNRPDITPDGNWIVYASWLNNQSRIWKIPIDGGTPIQITNHDSLAPDVSPDAKLIACTFPSDSRAKTARLDIVSFESGEIVKSFQVLPFDYTYNTVRWTPSGDAIVFNKNEKNIGNLWKQNIAGGDPQPFTDFKSQLILNYAFSQTGKDLLLSRGDTKVTVVLLKHFR